MNFAHFTQLPAASIHRANSTAHLLSSVLDANCTKIHGYLGGV